MTKDQFWLIVDKVHARAPDDMDRKCELLGMELRQLPAPEVKAFSNHFDDCLDAAYSWDLWAAAYIIGGGCSDDSFSDFRSSLISLGRATFEKVIASPASLIDVDGTEDTFFYEGYQYIPTEVYEEMTGNLPVRVKPYPEEPSGKPWEEDSVDEMFPALAEKYG